MPDLLSIQKCLTASQTYLLANVYTISDTQDEEVRTLEESEGIQPSMVFLLTLRALRMQFKIFPTHSLQINTANLLDPLPSPEVVPEVLKTIMAIPPSLTPKFLVALLGIFTSKQCGNLPYELLCQMLKSSVVFSYCPDEVHWWLDCLPNSLDVIVGFTNLLGSTTKNVHYCYDIVQTCSRRILSDRGVVLDSPFSALLVSIVKEYSEYLANPNQKSEFSSEFFEYSKRVICTLKSAQIFPEAFLCLIELFGVELSEQVSSSLNCPTLKALQLLQDISKAPCDSNDVNELVSLIKNCEVSERVQNCLEVILNHPMLSILLRKHGQMWENLILALFSSKNFIASTPLKLKCLKFIESEIMLFPTDEVCRVAHDLFREENRTLDVCLNCDSLSPRQLALLIPILKSFPHDVYQSILTQAKLEPSILPVILNGLRISYPILEHSISDSFAIPPLDLSMLNKEFFAYIMDQSSINSEIGKTCAKILVICVCYSRKFFSTLLNSALKGGNPTISHFSAIIEASVTLSVGFQLVWQEWVDRSNVLRVARMFPTEINSSNETVALVVMQALNEAQCTLPVVSLNSTLSSVLVNWNLVKANGNLTAFVQSCISTCMKSSHCVEVKKVFSFLRHILLHSENGGSTSFDNSCGMFSFLAKSTNLDATYILKSFVPILIANESTSRISMCLQVILESAFLELEHTHATLARQAGLLQAAYAIFKHKPQSFCTEEFLCLLGTNYTATLHPKDTIILAILRLFELEAGTHMSHRLMLWGTAFQPSNVAFAVEDSINLVDKDEMWRSLHSFPLDLELEDFSNVESDKYMKSAVFEKDFSYPYDPRFFQLLSLKYLEYGNSIDIQTLLDRNLISLAICSLSSQMPLMRRCGLAILDEFFSLIEVIYVSLVTH
jgi:hypothetical protein